MNRQVQLLENLLTRIQTNRHKPRRIAIKPAADVLVTDGRRRVASTPLERAVKVELESTHRPSKPQVPAPKPASAPVVAALPESVSPPAASPAQIVRPTETVSGTAITHEEPVRTPWSTGKPLEASSPIAQSVTVVDRPAPTTFGLLIRRTLSLRPRKR